ncbi:MAG TPA: hypothetical protein VFE33_32710 [Thermoanaerobaculia bacterium]|nr:hypothetical protein [Thermoanaerobaculia bacterium]
METKEREAVATSLPRRLGGAALVAVIAAFGAAAVQGQVETGLRFNFSTPGARSLAMGGAFIGLADDSTAAYTNPAGLSNLTVGGSEVAIEGRSWRYYNRYPSGGNLSPSGPTGIGIDTFQGPSSGTSAIDTRGISFLSFGKVLAHGWTVALYRHELLHFSNRYVSQGIFYLGQGDLGKLQRGGCFDALASVPCRSPILRTDLSAQVENYGISLAHEILVPFQRRDDSVSLGIGLSYYRFHGHNRQDFFSYDPASGDPNLDRLPGFLFGPADLLEDHRLYSFSTDDTDSAIGFNAGALWKIGKRERWSLGAVYRRGARFTTAGHLESGPLLQDQKITVPDIPFRLPDSWGVGVAYAPDSRSKITLDFDQVRYSQRLRDEFSAADREGLKLNDGNELHLGFEKVFSLVENLFVVTVRLGAWQESYHEIRGTNTDAKLFFPSSGKGTLHGSGGLGLVIKEDYQIDVAADLSSRANTVSLSVVRFF